MSLKHDPHGEINWTCSKGPLATINFKFYRCFQLKNFIIPWKSKSGDKMVRMSILESWVWILKLSAYIYLKQWRIPCEHNAIPYWNLKSYQFQQGFLLDLASTWVVLWCIPWVFWLQNQKYSFKNTSSWTEQLQEYFEQIGFRKGYFILNSLLT